MKRHDCLMEHAAERSASLHWLRAVPGSRCGWLALWIAVVLLGGAPWMPAWAFPPAPTHNFFGTVRDEMGDPILVTNAVVILETQTGIRLKTAVLPKLGGGMNYELAVPMDSGLTSDNYKPSALRPTVSFRFKVQVGQSTYLPIELRGDYAALGKPAQRTHLDLTLGEDSDGDGLPDAWERALIAMMGTPSTLADIKPQDDPDHDGLSNLQEYVAGTYAFDPVDGFRLEIAGQMSGRPVLEFLAIRGRNYTLLGSVDARTWTPLGFRLVDDGPAAGWRATFSADSVRSLRIEPDVQEGQDLLLFKLLVK